MKNLLPTTGRRGFLQGAGFLAVSFSLPVSVAFGQEAADAVELPGDLANNPMLDSWIRINADGTVTLLVGKVELGQGNLTAYSQIAAEELDIERDRLTIISGDTFQGPNQGTTAGSSSMPNGGPAVQMAAAEVRQILLEMAAEHLGESADGLTVEDGTISGAGGQTTYWDLVTGQELHREATGNVTPKDPSEYRLIGQAVPRLDFPDKMTGRPIFVHDMRPEGMVHGQIARPPTYRARLVDVDTSGVEAMPGVLHVVRNGSFLGVIAEREDQASAAAAALRNAAEWEVESVLPTNDGIFDWLLEQETSDSEYLNQERTEGGDPVTTLEATYYRPYQMHASLGPSAAVAMMGEDGVLTIHTHSQSVHPTANAIAAMLGMEQGQVRCIHTQGSGCYGHNMADDAAAEAALLAVAFPGRPVRLQIAREDEHRWEPYGSAMVIKTRAGIDGEGNVLDWEYELWSTPHGTRPGGNPGNLLPARYLENAFEQPTPSSGGPPSYNSARNAIAPYEFPGHRVVDHFISQMPLRVSSTRSLGSYGNVFAGESFMDEVAHAAGADPVEFRLRHISDERARDVITAAAERFGWDNWEPRDNRGRGFAYARYKNYAGMVAVAVEVEVSRRNGRVRVIRAAAAADVGQIVNPDGVINQVEGGFIQALSWTLKEEVRFDDTRVLSEDWSTYPIITFSEVPQVEVVLIDRPGEPYLGTGEACCGQAAASVANAIFDATGVRFRHLPFTPQRIQDGLRA